MTAPKTRNTRRHRNNIIEADDEIEEVKQTREEFKNQALALIDNKTDFIQYLLCMPETVNHNTSMVNSLHFNNPTDKLATRCDVIYKTLLRDCRKYFVEVFSSRFGNKRMKENQTLLEGIREFWLERFRYCRELLTSILTYD